MPLPVLLTLVIGGISLIGLLLHLTGHSRRFALDSEATARAQWLRHYPEDRIRAVLLASDRRAALIETEAGFGLVWSFGADTAAQRLSACQAEETAAGLLLRTGAFTAPKIRLALTPEERPLWRARLTGAPT